MESVKTREEASSTRRRAMTRVTVQYLQAQRGSAHPSSCPEPGEVPREAPPPDEATRSRKHHDGIERCNRQANTPSVFEELDRWIRRRLRQMIWKRWKRGTTRYRELIKLGVPAGRAGLGAVGKSPWHMSKSPVVHEALSNVYFRRSGLKSLKTRYQELRVSR
jgi:hypothetical protein